jgi:hypothetical protein
VVFGNRCENAPRLDVSDRTLDWDAQAVYVRIEFFLPLKQLPAPEQAVSGM